MRDACEVTDQTLRICVIPSQYQGDRRISRKALTEFSGSLPAIAPQPVTTSQSDSHCLTS